MPEQDYSNREITSMFEHIKNELAAIKEQTIKTNGRVSRLETWKTMLHTAGAVLATVAGVIWTGVTFIFK